MVNVAILGYGTVGSGVAQVLRENADIISRRAGKDICVKYILDLRDFPGDPCEKLIVHNFDTILNDNTVDVICETMGGTKPAYDFTKAALEMGKSVCTSNKELVEAHGAELLAIARLNNSRYLFEASVGGGIPIIRTLSDALTAENISKITGILNGTTNYILTRMDKEGAGFEEVLKDAQDNGYAEKDPTADVGGHDACRKIAILTSLVTGKRVDHNEIHTEGITKITAQDFAFAKAMGRSIKLLGMSRIYDEGVSALVAPFMLGSDHPLNGVSGVFNAVHIHSDMLDDSMYYGRGAGKLATASAVCADVIECACHPVDKGRAFWKEQKLELKDNATMIRDFFIRVDEKVLSREALTEALKGKAAGEAEFVLAPEAPGQYGALIRNIKEGDMQEVLEKNKGIINCIRML